ncbi:MAG: nitroreductase family protein [Candidatus Micrarchaeota archaeon]
MELQEAIVNRRSIRKYGQEQVSDEDLRKVLQSGMDAPSAGNLQSRHFYAVKDLAMRRGLASAAHGQHFISEAPVAIVVCVDSRIDMRYGERGKNLYAVMDCAASVQNMMLTAHELGLGTCWVGAFDEREAARAINTSPYLRPVAILPLGKAAESPSPHKQKKFEDVCEFR